ncbi:hypothetical protein, partial [Streptomyces sp. ADI96-02]|uniref:hypothetical protein n=1 Tax=Streptomyces sp. ADI96-02 TaxID=1522760 RepID=UPI0019D04DFC
MILPPLAPGQPIVVGQVMTQALPVETSHDRGQDVRLVGLVVRRCDQYLAQPLEAAVVRSVRHVDDRL